MCRQKLMGLSTTATRHTIGYIALAALVVILSSCSGDDAADDSSVSFEVDPALIGPVYENAEVGFTFQPPVEWEILEGRQREAVIEALAAENEADTYLLQVRDLFFNTDTLSFASVAVVEDHNENGLDPATYANTFAETIGVDQTRNSDTEIAARMDFTVNGVSVTQFRHLQEDRVTFTLVLAGGEGDVVQLDYSIPTDAYQKESPKLESSIGTIETPGAD